jgi:alpha-tubulin suppressor-like RCC1 family protein
VKVVNATNIIDLATQNNHVCVVLAGDGRNSFACWGSNGGGRLGDGAVQDQFVPTKVVGVNFAVGLSGGDGHRCDLQWNRTVRCWGIPSPYTTPTRVGTISDAVVVAAGPGGACAISSDSTLRCWGPIFNTIHPTAIEEITSPVAVAIGRAHVCVLQSNGSVSCWGSNGVGQLDNGTKSPSETPVTVVGISNGIAIILSG